MGLKTSFLTGLYFKPKVLPYSLVAMCPRRLRERVLARLKKRRAHGLPDDTVFSVSGVLPEMIFRPLNLVRAWNLVHDWCACRWLRKAFRAGDRSAIFHGFQGSCLRSISVARHMGLIAVVEITQPLGAFSVVSEERARLGLRARPANISNEDLKEISLADFIIVQSTWSMMGIREVRPDARIVLLPLGVDTQRFKPGHGRPCAAGFRAMFVGQICVRKGVHHLLEAWRQSDIAGAELLIVGAPTDELGQRLVREDIPGVSWLGRVSTQGLSELYRQADVFVAPSLGEAGFNAVYEAGASGLPCVVSNNAGAFVRDGVEGFIMKVGDVKGLSDKLTTLYRNPELRQRMGINARRRAEEHSWERFGKRLVRAYEYMVATTSPSPTGPDFFEA